MTMYIHITVKAEENTSSRLEVFCKKGIFKNFAKFTGKHLYRSHFFNKVKSLRYRCFLVNFANFLRVQFFMEKLRWLLLRKLTGIIFREREEEGVFRKNYSDQLQSVKCFRD